MGVTDDELNADSRQLLDQVARLRDVEERKRRTARSSTEFHRLAEEAAAIAREVFTSAERERTHAREDSPDPAERQDQEPGDWSGEQSR